MTATQRRARLDVRRYGVDCEIALVRADAAPDDRWRQYHLDRAARLADLARAIAPAAAAPRGAA